jgi:hypothetical protein
MPGPNSSLQKQLINSRVGVSSLSKIVSLFSSSKISTTGFADSAETGEWGLFEIHI